MPRRAAATLSSMADTMSDDDLNSDPKDTMPTPDSSLENIPPGKRRAPGRPKAAAPATRVTKAKAPSRRTSGASLLGAKQAATRTRSALAERRNQNNASDTEEVDDFDELPGSAAQDSIHQSIEVVDEADLPKKPVARRGRSAKPRQTTAEPPLLKPLTSTKPDRKARAQSVDIPSAPLEPKPSTRRGRPKRAISVEPMVMIPETQPERMDFEQPTIIPEEPTDLVMEEVISRQSRVRDRPTLSVARQMQPPSSVLRKRATSQSDTERGTGEPLLRRKLGETTKRLDALELKYNSLREVGTREAESNFDKLKKASEEKARDADKLIASLKKQLAAQTALAAESKALRTQLSSLTTENNKLVTENKSLATSLQAAQNETKALSAKLAANRAAAANVHSADGPKMPGSAVKAQRTVMVGSQEATKDAQVRQLKEELYSDLTGLVLVGVKREKGEDIYDCIQTGRNGTLHFHLSVPSAEAIKTSEQNYEEAEFEYTPLLHEERDRELLAILPDYLTEEICFPRHSAAKFFARILDCMGKRIVVEGE